MIYLSGAVRQEVLGRADIGVMLQPNMGNRPNLSHTVWAADNGCFSASASYSDERFFCFLDEMLPWQRTCLFAVAPDVLGRAWETWQRSKPVLHEIRKRGYLAALVGQDGLERLYVPWAAFDVLFIGGTTAWKLSDAAYRLAREADDRGKWVHMGRVNSWKRIKKATVAGYDSADGTFLAFGPDQNLRRLERWLETLRLHEAQTEALA